MDDPPGNLMGQTLVGALVRSLWTPIISHDFYMHREVRSP